MSDLITKFAPKLFRSLYVGPPTSGTWLKYDIVIDLLGDRYVCSDDGSPGIWQLAPLNVLP